MKLLRVWWWKLTQSLWFFPTALVLSGMTLAVALVDAESYVNFKFEDRWPRLFGVGPDGARGMLTAIASSMITVAGVVFSVTIVALSLAASQYSPRILRTFSSDRPTQLVLGVFVGIYVYCLVVLRTIRGGDSSFVPALAVLGGLVLALIGTGFLIFFIHHLAGAIQPSSILARITVATLATVDGLFPQEVGLPADEDELDQGAIEHTKWTPVNSPTTGYLTSIDDSGLFDFAESNDTVVRMEVGIGDFVIEGRPLASIASDTPAGDEAAAAIAHAYSFERQRTLEQDAKFGLQQIVDIGCKALSPGVNDASTAVLCIDRITQVLSRLAARSMETRFRAAGGRLRVIARSPSFEDFAQVAYGGLRADARGNAVVLTHLVWSLEEVLTATKSAARRRVVFDQLQRTINSIHQQVAVSSELKPLLARALELATGSASPRNETSASQ